MTEEYVRALFLLANIKVLGIWQIENKYWPDTYVEKRRNSPWWLVKTDLGLIEVGWRKKVISINWSDTKVSVIVTSDDVTKTEFLVHAWSYSKALEYLTAFKWNIDVYIKAKSKPVLEPPVGANSN